MQKKKKSSGLTHIWKRYQNDKVMQLGKPTLQLTVFIQTTIKGVFKAKKLFIVLNVANFETILFITTLQQWDQN